MMSNIQVGSLLNALLLIANEVFNQADLYLLPMTFLHVKVNAM